MFKKFILLALALTLGACGTGQDSGSTSSAGKLSLFITDNLTQVYSEVWVTVLEVEANAADGSKVTLYENNTGTVFNLAELAGIGELLNTQSIPAGTYNSVEIKLAKNVNLVTIAGDTEARVFATPGNSKSVHIKVAGTFTVNADQTTSIALDFDLNQFMIDSAGNVVPVVKFVKDINKQLKQALAKVHGQIVAVSDTGFTLQAPNGVLLNIVYGANTILVNENGAEITSVAVGNKVKVSGAFNLDSTAIEAYSVVLMPTANGKHEDDASNGLTEIKGVVTAVSDTQITLDIKHAGFIPGVNTMDVSIDASTTFVRGTSQVLEVGQIVEVKGTIVDGVLIAKTVEIEGAGCHEKANNTYAKVVGTVVSASTDAISVKVSRAKNVDLAIDQEFSVNLAEVTIKNGNAADLIAGVTVEIKGTVDTTSNTLSPVIVEIENNEHENDDSDESNANGKLEIKAKVISQDASQITVEIVKAEHAGQTLVGQQISFTLSENTVFVHQIQPAVNDLVIIYASVNNDVYTALMIKVASLPITPFFAEIKGTVVSISDTEITITVTSAEHTGPSVTVGENLTIALDTAVVFVDNTTPAVGDTVEIKILPGQTTLTARSVEVKSPAATI